MCSGVTPDPDEVLDRGDRQQALLLEAAIDSVRRKYKGGSKRVHVGS